MTIRDAVSEPSSPGTGTGSPRADGRTLGALLLLQLAGLIVPFILIMPVTEPGYLLTVVPVEGRVRLGLLLLIGNGALTVAISGILFRQVRPITPVLGGWLLILGVAMLLLQAVDTILALGMLTAADGYSAATERLRTTMEAPGTLLAGVRHAAHYVTLLAIGSWMLVFYATLWRARLVPRALAALGVIAALSHLSGISLPVLLGAAPVAPMAMVLAVSHLALAGRLLVVPQVAVPTTSMEIRRVNE